MSCNTCTTVCNINPCYSDLWVCKATADTDYQIEITNLGSERTISEQVTSDEDGYILLEDGTWSNFFNSGSQFQIKIYAINSIANPVKITNSPIDFNVILTADGESPLTVSENLYDCILFQTDLVYSSEDSPADSERQYLMNADA